MQETGKKKRQACIGNVYNYTLQDDPQNVKGNLIAKSSLFVHKDDFFFSPWITLQQTGVTQLERPVIKDVLLLVSQL